MRRFLHKVFGIHWWNYRNPYDRTCKLCRRHEVEFFYPSGKGREVYGGMRGWNEWEVYYDGEAL